GRPPSLCLCTDSASTESYTLSLHDALPIFDDDVRAARQVETEVHRLGGDFRMLFLVNLARTLLERQRRIVALGEDENRGREADRSEEHTSELQSRENLVCRLLLEKKKRKGR